MSTLALARALRPHFIYRIFDIDDQLLYIGCAENVETRLFFHSSLSSQSPTSWEIARRITRHTSEEFPTLEAARSAERHAIKTEMPLLNRQHNPSRVSRKGGRYIPTTFKT
jgi:predicted GIY-YIG superfamily endonuclease